MMKSLPLIALTVSGVGYCVGAFAYAYNGKWWMASVLVFYAASCFGLYMAGDH